MCCCVGRSIGCRSKIIAAKIQASKRVLQRQIRNYGENAAIQSAVDALNISLRQLKGAAELRH